MNAKKRKAKERRRARRLAEQAWDAANDHNLDLALKIIRRAVETQPENPVLWNDQGILQSLDQKDVDAAESFRAAISLAPDFAEPYSHLAALRARQGFLDQAITLQSQAAKYAPRATRYADRLESYESLLVQRPAISHLPSEDIPINIVEPRSVEFPSAEPSEWDSIVSELPWHDLQQQLTRDGCVMVPKLVRAGECARLRQIFDDDARFVKTVVMDSDDFGQGVYRYFQSPIPGVVNELRCAVYPHVARIANAWHDLLGKRERYPAVWDDFRKQCHCQGQTTSTAILLKYGPKGFNALHRDLRGKVFFPIQMAIVLSPRPGEPDSNGGGFRGGEFVLCDVPERRKSSRRAITAGLGDMLLFCTRDRLLRVGGIYGLQPVKHGTNRILSGTRYVLGVPFHEYR